MNALQQSALMQALGWSVADSIWQMGIAWLMYFLFVKFFSLTAVQRHNLAVLALSAGSLAFVISIVYRLSYPGVPGYIDQFFVKSELFNRPFSETIFPYLSAVYLMVAFFMLLRFTWLYSKTKELNRISRYKAPLELRLFAENAAINIGIRKKVKIGITAGINTPVTIGFFKPIILLPVSVTNHLSLQQAETILLHELFHIKRNDYLINILVNFSSIFLYFNPFAKLIANAIKTERELCCDDAVLQFNYEPQTYASALFELEKLRQSNTPVLAMAATGKGNLIFRIKRIISGKEEPTISFSGIFWGMASLLIIVVFALVAGTNFYTSRLVTMPNYSLELFRPELNIQHESKPLKKAETVEIVFRELQPETENLVFLEKTNTIKEKTITTYPEILPAPYGTTPADAPLTEDIQAEIENTESSWEESKNHSFPKLRFVEKEATRAYSLAAPGIYEAPEFLIQDNLAYLPKNVLNFNAQYLKDTIPLEHFSENMQLAKSLMEAKMIEFYQSGAKMQAEAEQKLKETLAIINHQLSELNSQRARLHSQEALRQAENQLYSLQQVKITMQEELNRLKNGKLSQKRKRIVEL